VEIGWNFSGLMDDLMISRRALKPDELRAIVASADRTRYPVTLSPLAGSPNARQWQVNVPTGLESFYQIDLLVTDERGNQRLVDNVWRGVIDTLAPRITIQNNVTGQIFDDAATGAPRYDIGYTIRAEDMHLDGESIASLCSGRVQPQRSYVSDAWVNTIFPDMTVRNVMTLSCHDWATQADPTTQATACDFFGHCATVSHTVQTSTVVQAASALDGKPVIVWPPVGSVIAITDTLTVQMAMNSSTPLREMGVMNMAAGQALDMLQFAQDEQDGHGQYPAAAWLRPRRTLGGGHRRDDAEHRRRHCERGRRAGYLHCLLELGAQPGAGGELRYIQWHGPPARRLRSGKRQSHHSRRRDHGRHQRADCG
jgi:hypothetical protein